MRTIYRQFKEAALKYKRRPIVHFKRQSRWRSMNYLNFLKRVDQLAEGFRGLGVEKGGRVVIMSENGPDWLASDLALNKLGAISVPIHTTSHKPLINFILADSMSGFFIVSENCLKKHQETICEIAGKVKTIICHRQEGLREDYGKDFIDFDNLLTGSAGAESRLEELSSLIYTSGTTGDPKGVILTNENFLSNAYAALEKITVYPSDVFLSFLPLSHVLERLAGNYIPILSGASIAYATSIKELPKCLKEVKPTIFIGVPKIYENSYEKIINEVEKSNVLIKKLFYSSLNFKSPRLVKIIAEGILYKKIRKSFGGRLRFSISGGASINERVIKFFRKIGIKIIEGYGLTETSPIVTVNLLENFHMGTVGQPLPGVEVKIGEDKEILVRGKNVMRGYWNNPGATGEAITEDGWFKTGDLGFLDREKFLTIIGRKKEIIVTSNGKNISPEKVEAIINLNPLISQCLVVGHKKPFLTCLIVPDKEKIAARAGETLSLNEVIEKEIEMINNHLMSHERVRKVAIIDAPFSIDEGELTPTLKVRRSVIEHKYKKVIERIYN